MYRGTKDIMLPTTITGSLPRPSWYTENLGTRHFLEAMVTRKFREQYEDALTCYIRDQEMAGFEHDNPRPTPVGRGGVAFPRGHILHDYMESRVMPTVIGPIGRGDLQY